MKALRNYLSMVGLFFGATAISIAVFQESILELSNPTQPKVVQEKKEKETLKGVLLEIGKEALKDKFLKKEKQKEIQKEIQKEKPKKIIKSKLINNWVQVLYSILGLIALFCGILSWVYKDHIRLSGASIATGLIAIAWHYVLIGVCIAVVIIVLSNVG